MREEPFAWQSMGKFLREENRGHKENHGNSSPWFACALLIVGAEIRSYFAFIAILSPFTVTSATIFSPLSVRTSLPSAKCIMLRITPPPPGMSQVWNFSVLGSKRTNVFGFTPDSLYHTIPFTIVIP